jgi:hypothetical protein
MKTAASLFQPWRRYGAPVHPARGRRAWHLELGLRPAGEGAAGSDDEAAFDSSWFESSRALALGLEVTEIGSATALELMR